VQPRFEIGAGADGREQNKDESQSFHIGLSL
jgi:hypothetical protein